MLNLSFKSELFDKFMSHVYDGLEIKEYPGTVTKSLQEIDESFNKVMDLLYKGGTTEEVVTKPLRQDSNLIKEYQAKLESINNDLQRLIYENFKDDSGNGFNRSNSDIFKQSDGIAAATDSFISIEKQIRRLNELLKPVENKHDASCKDKLFNI
jgi:hypothetical protein